MSEIFLSLKNVKKVFKKSQFFWQSFKGAVIKGEVLKTFKNQTTFTALDGISLDIYKGETFGVIGENGAGKSTILKLFANILKPTSGQVIVKGRTAALIELGAGFHPEISGEENIIINGIILGLKKKEIKKLIPQIVEFAELKDFIKEPVKVYSSGMYARLGFAIAIFVNAPILLVDEVLAVGDEHFSKKCISKIRQLQKEGKTIVFVSHDLPLISDICHRVCLLEKGKIKHIGNPDETINIYKSNIEVEPLKEEEILRYGNKRVIIEKILLKKDEVETNELESSNKATFEIHFKNMVGEKDLVFGIAFFKEDGNLIYGTNTNIDRFTINSDTKEGVISFELPSLSLTSGNYYIDIAIHSSTGVPYDYWKKCFYFKVISKIQDVGGFRPNHRWILS